MNMHPGPPQRVQIDELLVGGNDKGGANLDTAQLRERPSRVAAYMEGGQVIQSLGTPDKEIALMCINKQRKYGKIFFFFQL